MRDSLEPVAQLRLFDSELCFGRKMLQRAAAANAEVRAAWGNPVRRWRQNFDEAALIVLTMATGALIANLLPG
jgi:hypothetical protein